VARGKDDNDKPVEPATRFISPAYQLYAFVTLHNVHRSDVLRFRFELNGLPLPTDDNIQYPAHVDAPVHSFYAYADNKQHGKTGYYRKGATPCYLPQQPVGGCDYLRDGLAIAVGRRVSCTWHKVRGFVGERWFGIAHMLE